MLNRVLIVDPVGASREALAERLRSLGYSVSLAADGVEAAHAALEDPPGAVVADLAMPSISGVQLCRLLQAEPGTAHVPVVLRGEDGRRSRFWAEQAGAAAYVVKGHTGDLVRALRKALAAQGTVEPFFMAMPSESDIRDRIAGHLDAALFEMVIASEVRKLGTSESFPHLFDLLAQFVSQVTSYRWLALVPDRARFLGLHANPATRVDAERSARATLEVGSDVVLAVVEDDDADPGPADAEVVGALVLLGERTVGRIAMCPAGSALEAESLLRIVSRELGGPLQMALLVEESQRHATIDALTGRLNRRAFLEAVEREVSRCRRYGDGLSLLLLDIDHFKAVNDQRGHAGGDLVLRALGALLGHHPRKSDLAARWGGEEFVVAMPSTQLENALLAADRLREAIAGLAIRDSHGELVPVTASIGVAALGPDDTLEQLIDRADRAMYQSKVAGRNQSHAARLAADGQVVFDRPATVHAA